MWDLSVFFCDYLMGFFRVKASLYFVFSVLNKNLSNPILLLFGPAII